MFGAASMLTRAAFTGAITLGPVTRGFLGGATGIAAGSVAGTLIGAKMLADSKS
jgi:hypothetical protein